jgi:hypothetical protein
LQTLRNNKEELNEERIDINYFLDRLEEAISKDPYLEDSSIESLLAHIRTLPGVGEIESKRADQKYFLKFAEFLDWESDLEKEQEKDSLFACNRTAFPLIFFLIALTNEVKLRGPL